MKFHSSLYDIRLRLAKLLMASAEWEHAFRCGTTTRFFVGDDVSRMLEYGRVFAIKPGPGKCFFPNPLGLFDMLGNDWEMCWDQGINQYGTGLSLNPVGPIGRRYAMRGGAAEAGLFYLHGSARPNNDASVITAFRIVCGPLNMKDTKNDKMTTLSALNHFLEPHAKSSPQLWTECGRLYAEMEQYDDAVAAFAKGIEMNPDDPQVWKERGRVYFAMGQTDKSTADFCKAIERLGDEALLFQPKTSEADKLFAQLADDARLKLLTTAIEGNPEDMAKRWQRGEWFARHRRWKEAADDFKLALEREPPANVWQWLHVAPAFLVADDREGYRWLCREARQHFGDSQDPKIAKQLAQIHLLLCDGNKEVQWAGQLIDRSISAELDEVWLPYRLLYKCLADYRRDNLDATVQGLNALLQRIDSKQGLDEPLLRVVSRKDLSASCHLLLAMALYKKGQTAASKEYFERGSRLLNQFVPHSNLFPLENAKQYNHDWLIVSLFHQEAQTLIEGKKVEPKK